MTVFMRLIALFLILAALVLLGMDAVSSLERGGEITVRSAGMIWSLINPESLGAFKDWVAHNFPKAAQGVYSALEMPGWGLTGVIGVLIAFIFSRRHGPDNA